jgi:hypothetical protein
MNFSYKEKPDKLSLLVAARFLDIHLVNRAARTKEFCLRWHLNYFKIQIGNLRPRVADVFLELRDKYPRGKVVIFLVYCSFFGSLAQKGYLGYFIPDRDEPKMVLVDMVTGEKEFHSAVFGVELEDLSSNTQKYREF